MVGTRKGSNMEDVRQSVEWKRQERRYALERQRKKIINLTWASVILFLAGTVLFLVVVEALPRC